MNINCEKIKKIFKSKIKNKRVMIFDLETTGLPERRCRDYKNPSNEYYNPRNIHRYDKSRIVQFLRDYESVIFCETH